MNKRISRITLFCFVVLLTACAGNTQPTRYYTLSAPKDSAPTDTPIDSPFALGVGPLVLPEILDRSGIVSFKSETELNVAGYHIWAGELHDTFIRVLTDNLSNQLNTDNIWSFPWDNRNRPHYQVRIIIEEFSGTLGGDASLRAKWTLLGDAGRTELATHRSTLRTRTQGGGYANYVSALNELLSSFSRELAMEISRSLSQTDSE